VPAVHHLVKLLNTAVAHQRNLSLALIYCWRGKMNLSSMHLCAMFDRPPSSNLLLVQWYFIMGAISARATISLFQNILRLGENLAPGLFLKPSL
jgi:hypothetical protein